MYVDDLTISGSAVPGRMVWETRQLIHSVGLRSNRQKERRHENGRREVTGVIVDNETLRIPKRGYEKLRARKSELASSVDPEDRLRLRNSIRSIEAQHNQVRRSVR